MNSTNPGFRTDFDSEFMAGRLALLLGLLMLLMFPDILLGSHAFFYRDSGLYGYPVAYYGRYCIHHGELPFWNPYNNCGIPFMAQWNTLVLYPLSVIVWLLPMPWGMNYFLLGHFFLGAIGMYFLAYRWFGSRFAATVAGLAFVWNGLSLNCLLWPCHTAALGWMPWVILLCDRAAVEGKRTLFLASLAGACQMLTGSPEFILFTWLFVAGNFALNVSLRGAVRLAAIVILVAALSAAQLLPWFDLLRHGDRDSSFGNNFWALPAWGVANFLVPLFRSTSSVSGVFTQDEQQWTSSYYGGIVVLMLALLAVIKVRRGRTLFLGVAALAGIIFALGDSGIALKILKQALPAIGFTRYPIKFIAVTIFCLPLLAASGIVWLIGSPAKPARLATFGISALLVLGVMTILAAAYYFPFPGDSWSVVWQNGASRLLVLILALAAIYWQPKFQKKSAQLTISFGLLLLLGLDISTHMPRQNPTVITRAYEADRPQMTSVPRLGESRAMLSRRMQSMMENLVHPYPLNHYLGQRAELFSNCNLLNRIPKVNGFFPLHLRENAQVLTLLYGGPLLTNLAQFLGVSQITSDEFLFGWNAQTNFMPMATIGQKPVFLKDSAILAALAFPHFAPRKTVYLPVELSGAISATSDPRAKILSSQTTPNNCQYHVHAETKTMLVIAQSYYHCWKAFIDGRETTLLRANAAFQALEIPPGDHEVRLAYEDRAFHVGALISAAALLVCLAGLWKRTT